MRIGIVDDERPARSELTYLLQIAAPEAELVEADSPEMILQVLKEGHLDACFVDINLNGMNGTTLASLMRQIQPDLKIIFATAYPDYAVRAFELGAIDYILKPFELNRVEESVRRLTQEAAAKEESHLPKIMVQGRDSIRLIDVKEIVYIETSNRSCLIHTAKETFEENQTLNYYEKRLAGENFFRIHKSYLVNLAYLKELVPYYNNGYGLKLKYFERAILPVGRQQIRVLKQRLE